MMQIGVDGCPKGWVAASLEPAELQVFDSFASLLAAYPTDTQFLVDIPIGLDSRGHISRPCEADTRRILSAKRKSSVFSVPCREAVYKSDYKEASATNLEILSKRLSRQSWHICRKIAELDMLLCKEPALRSRVRESHPEVAFHFLNGGSSMLEAKKTDAGIAERLALLTSLDDRIMNCYSEALARYPRKAVSRDDLLDALCLAVTLRQIMAHGGFRPGAGVDAAGIEMQIHYFDPSATSAEHISDAGG